MDAPKCKTCGVAHWGTCAEALAGQQPEPKRHDSSRPAERVRDPADVARIAALEAENRTLRDEVEALRVTPAPTVEAGQTVTPRNANAERQRRYRERRKAQDAP